MADRVRAPTVPRSDRRRVVLVDLGRASAMGARLRLAGLVRGLETLGVEALELPVLPDHRAKPAEIVQRAPSVLRSAGAVPETLAWSPRSVRAALERLEPDAVICVTSRCYHPGLAGPWMLGIDFVDRLSVSYGDRLPFEPSLLKRLRYRVLQRPQKRFEQRPPSNLDLAFAAGRSDAEALGVDWVPITLDIPAVAPPHVVPDTDLVFAGTLDYPPNIEAVLRLSDLWPRIQRARPGTRLLVAGARPVVAAQEASVSHGWCLEPDFSDTDEIYLRSRVAVAPLRHASGMQIKVLDAAARGVPQIVSPVVAGGFDSDFPIRVADNDDDWVESIVDLLTHPEEAASLGARSQEHVRARYGPDEAARRLREVLAPRPSRR